MPYSLLSQVLNKEGTIPNNNRTIINVIMQSFLSRLIYKCSSGIFIIRHICYRSVVKKWNNVIIIFESPTILGKLRYYDGWVGSYNTLDTTMTSFDSNISCSVSTIPPPPTTPISSISNAANLISMCRDIFCGILQGNFPLARTYTN